MANIIKFQSNKSVHTSVGIKRNEAYNRYFYCKHHAIELDCIYREVRCRQCGALLDPFSVLEEFGKEERLFIFESAKCRAAIEEFKRIESEWSLTTREKRRIANARQQATITLSSRLSKKDKKEG